MEVERRVLPTEYSMLMNCGPEPCHPLQDATQDFPAHLHIVIAQICQAAYFTVSRNWSFMSWYLWNHEIRGILSNLGQYWQKRISLCVPCGDPLELTFWVMGDICHPKLIFRLIVTFCKRSFYFSFIEHIEHRQLGMLCHIFLLR